MAAHDGRSHATKHYGADWRLTYDEANNSAPFNTIHAILLQEIRDELKTLNRLLACPNFTGIPATLRVIAREAQRQEELRQTRLKARRAKKR